MSSSLEAVRDSLAELERLDKSVLLHALMDAHLRLKTIGQENAGQEVSVQHATNQADLFSRRCDLAAAICSNDENGLSRQTLDAIAALIWPPIVDPLSIPTSARETM